MEKKIQKRIPASDSGARVTCSTKDGDYIVSQNVERRRFTLWHKVKDGYEKIKVGSSPLDLYELVPW